MTALPDLPAVLYLIHTQDEQGRSLAGVQIVVTSPNGDWSSVSNECGDVINPESGLAGVTLAPGHYSAKFYYGEQQLRHAGSLDPLEWDLAWPPKKPILVGLASALPTNLRAIKGAIWPTRSNVAFGPRPGKPDNITDTGCEAYSPTDLQTAIDTTKARRYTHVQVGPFIDGGYHGQYPPVDFRNNPDEVLAWLENYQAHGLAIVAFIGPDGWTTEQMKTLEPIFLQPRWQNVMKQIVPMGWEPSKDTPNSEFVARYQWAKRVFPNALQYIHLAADFDAPGNNDDFTPGQPKFIGMPEAWHRVVPYLTGYLIQNGPYGTAPSDEPTTAKNFANQFNPDVLGSLANRFRHGYAGWPICDIDLINAECTSYNAYWNNLPEEASRAWGKLAMASGAQGYFDGGTD